MNSRSSLFILRPVIIIPAAQIRLSRAEPTASASFRSQLCQVGGGGGGEGYYPVMSEVLTFTLIILVKEHNTRQNLFRKLIITVH